MDKNILYICHAYDSFQKDSIESMSKYFRNVVVLVRSNSLIDISKYFHATSLEIYRSDIKIDTHNMPSNVRVYSTPTIYFPVDSQYKSLGQKHLRIVESFIKKYNIKFDIVHSNFTWSAGYVGAKLKEKYGVPFVVTAHGYDIYKLPFKDNQWKHKIKYVLNSADAIITVSNKNFECIKKLNVKTPVTVLPNGYKDDLFHPMDTIECKKLLGLPTYKKIILAVGNLEEVKGHKYLIEAINYIVKKREDVLCFIVGGGRLYKKLNKQIIASGLFDYVKLVGTKPHEDIPLWMNACDIFVLPSLSEGNPLVMFECLGCRKPFVGTRVGGIPEIIKSDDYGLLCDSGRPKELAKNILLALDKNWNFNSIHKYSGQFLWDEISKQVLDVYSQVISPNA